MLTRVMLAIPFFSLLLPVPFFCLPAACAYWHTRARACVTCLAKCTKHCFWARAQTHYRAPFWSANRTCVTCYAPKLFPTFLVCI
jgi:hypothetical protein